MLSAVETIGVALVCWLFVINKAVAQSPAGLATRLKQADEVILVSHKNFASMIDSAGNSVPIPPFVVNEQPNPKFFLKSRTLTLTERVKLNTILTRPFYPGTITVMRCCMPHHTIYLVEKGKTSYFDFCLSCRCLYSQGVRLPDFDNRRWEELDKFVDTLGMTYSGF